jgi:hypothetical protein
MKNLAAILFLLIYLFGNTNASQVMKLPLLVKHYLKHKQEDPSLTVGSFLKMHYVGQQPFDSDYQQDMQLPFKTPVDVCTLISPTILPVVPQISFTILVITPVKHTILNDRVPLYSYPHSIFQPPKA